MSSKDVEDLVFPASFSQKRLWFLEQYAPGGNAYNVPVGFRVRGAFDETAWGRALEALVRRHEILRTHIERDGDEVVQVISDEASLEIVTEDVRASADPPAEAVRFAETFSQRAFRLDEAPLFRVGAARESDDCWVLLLSFHHAICDGWSLSLLSREVWTLYAALVAGVDAGLPEPELAFVDFSEWQREWLTQPACARELAYWKRALASPLPVLEMHPDRARSKDASPDGATLHFSLTDALSRSVDELARSLATTPFVVLLSAYAVLLCSEADQDEIVIGSVVAGRTRREFESIVGFFANTLALRLDAPRGATFAEVARTTHERVLDAQSSQTTPFDRVVEDLDIERVTTHMPVFQTLFVLDNQEPLHAHPPGLELEPLVIESGEVPYDLTVSLGKAGARYDAHFRYASHVFDASRVRRLAERFACILERAVAAKTTRVSELDRVSGEHREIVLASSRGPSLARARNTVVDRLLAAASVHASRPAVRWRETSWTYDELFGRACALAHRLRDAGVGPDTRVGVVVDQRPEVIAGILAVILAGGAYVPLDPGAPPERRAFMVEDSACLRVLGLAERAEGSSYVSIDDLDASPKSSAPPATVHRAGSLAYVIYTSGSTGTPKGVAIEHHSLVDHLDAVNATFALRPGEVCLQFCSLAFDVSVEDVFLALTSGASLALRAPEMTVTAAAFCRAIDALGVTVLNLPTAFFGELERGLVEEQLVLPSAVRMVRIAGEAAPRDAVARWLADRRPRLINGYGPTETTIVVTEWCPEKDGALVGPHVPIGKPLPGTEALILNDAFDLVHIGMAGELFIGGDRVARGYLGRASLTAGSFVPHPTEPNQRLYRTGDLVRRREDGNIEFLRRRDRQIKLRGFRIELGEIESALRALPGVREASVLLVTARNGDSELRAFVAPPGLDVEAARTALTLTLPEYMVPSTYVSLDALPLTTSGKIDRQKLGTHVVADDVPVDEAPRSPTEARVALLFQELLALDVVPRQTSFFRLGGHSLLAARLVARLERAHGTTLPLRQVFETPTVAGLAAALDAMVGGEAAAPLVHVSREELAPLSTVQRRLFFLDQLEPGSAFYNMPVGVWIEGPLDVARLARAISRLVERHEGLRTQFVVVDGEPWQRVMDTPAVIWRHARCDAGTLEARRAQAEARASEEASRGFDLRSTGFRASLWEASDRAFLLTLVFHHVISDGWSMGIALRDLVALYEEPDAALPPLPFQYIDYADWQKRTASPAIEQRAIDYWRHALSGIPARLELPTDKPRPARKRYLGKSHIFEWGRELSASMRRFAQEVERTPFLVALTALSAFLHRLTGYDDVVIGAPASRRVRVELEDVLGCFVNTIVLRTRPTSSQSFADLLSALSATTEEAYAHQDVPFEKLVDALAPERTQAHTPLFQVMIVYNAPAPVSFGRLPARLLDLDAGTSTFDLTFTFDDAEDGLSLAVEYDTDLFEEATIAAWCEALGVMTAAALARPRTAIGVLPLVAGRPDFTLGDAPHGAFGEARGAPDDVAVRAGDVTVTYRELAQRTSAIAAALAAEGVKAGDRVAVCLPRDENLVPALRAVLALGAAYVPLDPAFPAKRLAQMVADACPRAALTSEALRPLVPLGIATVVVLDHVARTKGSSARMPVVPAPPPESPAYVLFTSGSTGRPKGVEVPHRAALQVLAGIQSHLQLRRDDVWLATTTLSFDISMLELFLPLQTGGTVALFPRDAVLDPTALLAALEATKTTVLQLTPSAWRLLLAAGFEGCPTLKHALTGGEAISPGLAASVASRVPVLWNVYGPTETTVWSSIGRIQDDPKKITIGRALPGNALYVVDPLVGAVPVGFPGELAIGGTQVALGYVGDPTQTATRFRPDPFIACTGARLYLTGDRARRLASGDVEWLGRIDAQIKHRGYRIELGEIDGALSRVANVGECATALHLQPDGRTRLVAYVLGDAADAASLRSAVESSLPPYMVPDALVRLESFPRTLNGKCDRKRLPWPAITDPAWADAAPGIDVDASEPDRPTSDRESKVGSAFAQTLGIYVSNVTSVDLDFFRAGGDSLSVLRLVALLRRKGLDVSIAEVASLRTVRGIARKARPTTAADVAPRSPAAAGARLPLTGIQKGFLFLSLGGDRTSYVEQSVFHAGAPVRRRELERAFERLVAILPTMRAFVDEEADGEPSLAYGGTAPTLRWVTAAATKESLDALLEEELSASWDPRRPPLVRAVVVDGGAEAWLVLSFHHIVLDGWSADLLVAALGELYDGHEPSVRDVHASFAAWSSAREQKLTVAEATAAFGGALEDNLRLFARGGERAAPSARVRYAQCERALDPSQAARLLAAAESLGVSPMAIFASAHASMVLGLSGEALGHVRFGTVFSGRSAPLPDVDVGVGMLANTLPVTIAVNRDEALRARAVAMHSRLSQLFLLEHTPLQASLAGLGGSTRELPFETLVVYAPRPDSRARSRRAFEPARDALPRTGYPLHLGIQPEQRGFVLTWTYDTARFDERDIDAIASMTMAYVAAVVIDPDRRAADVRDDAASAKAWRAVNDTTYPHALQRLDTRFAAAASAQASRVALAMKGETLTYAELATASRRLGARLASARTSRAPGVVALLFDRSFAMVLSLYATLEAGDAFLPLDPDAPERRLAELIEDADPVALLCDESHVAIAELVAGGRPITIVGAADLAPAKVAGDSSRDTAGARPLSRDTRDLAYVLFTSGSTGKPKAAMLEHAGVDNRLEWMQRAFPLDASDVVLQKTPYTFDVSMWELFWPLRVGARLAIAAPGAHYDPRTIAQTMADEGVTVAHFVPAMLQAFLEVVDPEKLPSLRLLFASGEALSPALARAVHEKLPWVALHNLYGPTEASIDVTWWPCPPAPALVPIGRPIDNVRTYVVDRDFHLVPPGVPGDLYLAGIQLARGYLNRPALTADRFLPDPFTSTPGERMYRTGDRARLLPDGTLEFLGRSDFQVKLRGLRIELGEIEGTLRGLPGVADAIVDVRTMAEPMLVAWIRGAELLDVGALRDELRKRVPAYMIPQYFVSLAAWPTTSSGKVDRRALPMPDVDAVLVGQSGAASSAAMEMSALEQRVAALFADVLGMRGSLDPHASFFDMGGHSMLALRLVSRAEREHGVRLALDVLFGDPTVHGFAKAIAAARATEDRGVDVLVPLAKGSGPESVFWLHPVGGGVLGYRALVKALGSDRSHYGVTSRAPSAREARTLLDLVELYGRAILSVADGPIHLVGWSLGGVLAWELAEWFLARGRTVGALVAIDSFARLPEGDVTVDTIELLANELRLPEATVAEAVLSGSYEGIAKELAGLSPTDLATLAGDLGDNVRRMRAHLPTIRARRLLLAEARVRSAGLEAPRDTWAPVGAQLELIEVDADHDGIVTGQNAEQLGRRIDEEIRAFGATRKAAP